MGVLEAASAGEVQAGGQGREDDLGDSVAAANGVLEDGQVAAVLDRLGDLGSVALDLVTRNLEHLVSVLGASTGAGAAANGLVAMWGNIESASWHSYQANRGDQKGKGHQEKGAETGRNSPQVGRDQAELVLQLEGRLEEAVHQLERVLMVGQHPAALNAGEVEVEVTLLNAGIEDLLDLTGLLGQQQAIVDGLHGPHRHLAALPLHRLGGVEVQDHFGSEVYQGMYGRCENAEVDRAKRQGPGERGKGVRELDRTTANDDRYISRLPRQVTRTL